MGPALGVRPPPHSGICQTTRNSSEILKERVPGNQCQKPGVFGEQEVDRYWPAADWLIGNAPYPKNRVNA